MSSSLTRSGQAGTGSARGQASSAPLAEAGGSSRSTIWSGVFEPATLFSFAGSPLPVASTERGTAVRAYVPGTLDLAVQQQPEGDGYYVSGRPDVLTQFRKATGNGVTGLLAHNHLAGENFYRLETGQKIWVAYSDGHYAGYTVAGVRRYQRIDASDLFSDFLDLGSGRVLSSTQVFNLYYKDDGNLILQTCLKRGGNWSWGLYFVIAEPDL